MDSFQDFMSLYDARISPTVPGWFYPPDIALFYILMSTQTASGLSGDVCEIGVYVGKSAIAMSRLRGPGETFYGYDTFDFDAEPGQLDRARANLARFSNQEGICLITHDSTTLRPEELPKKLRFVHVDGNHRHAYVWKDLCTFSPQIMDYGLIVLDDILDGEFPGVASAMAEFCLSSVGSMWRPFAIGQNKAYLCRRPLLDQYQTTILNAQVFPSCSTTQILDTEVLLCNSRQPLGPDELRRSLGLG